MKRRCEAAAAKAGGSPPHVLARVLACCGRFLELLFPEGAERMQRMRQEAAAAKPKSKADAMDSEGLEAMRAALTATEAEAVAELVAAADRCDNSAPSAISVLMAGGQIDGLWPRRRSRPGSPSIWAVKAQVIRDGMMQASAAG